MMDRREDEDDWRKLGAKRSETNELQRLDTVYKLLYECLMLTDLWPRLIGTLFYSRIYKQFRCLFVCFILDHVTEMFCFYWHLWKHTLTPLSSNRGFRFTPANRVSYVHQKDSFTDHFYILLQLEALNWFVKCTNVLLKLASTNSFLLILTIKQIHFLHCVNYWLLTFIKLCKQDNDSL